MDKDEWGVHETHCCEIHGCKYGDEDCPVVNKQIKQKYPCEICFYIYNIKTMREFEIFKDIVNIDMSRIKE